MAVEIEAKIKVERLDVFIPKINRQGGAFLKKVVQKDIFFDRSDGSLLKGDCGLRLRTESGRGRQKGVLCFKGARQQGPYKQREEIEVTVSDAQQAGELLHALGYKMVMVVEKQRRIYRLGVCMVCLDEVAGLGEFIEIEGPGAAAISRVQNQLGLSDAPVLHDSYAMMLAQAQGSRNRNPAQKP